jgi:glycosyltransferase involved in cell wall biosynthesis
MKNRNPKIIILIPSFDVGGAERQAFQFARYYKDNSGSDIEILGFFNPGKISQLCESSGIPWSLVPYPSSRFLPLRFFTAARLIIEFRKAKPDIILSYTFVPNVICGLIWKWTGAKLCIWNQRDEGVHYDIALLEKLAIKDSDHFISNSYQGARFLDNNFNIRDKTIKIIPNGVSLPEPKNSREEWRNSLKIKNETLLVCMVANLTERKDHITLLKSWRKVIDNFSDDVNKPILLLAGKKYEMYDALNTLADELNIHEHVRFLGQVEDISGLLNSVDLGVHSSKLEGCSNGLLECMASGLAVIATDIDANREALGKGSERCLVPEDNPNILAEKIIEFLKDEKIRKQFGLINKKRIIQKFSLEHTNKMMMDYVISSYEHKN